MRIKKAPFKEGSITSFRHIELLKRLAWSYNLYNLACDYDWGSCLQTLGSYLQESQINIGNPPNPQNIRKREQTKNKVTDLYNPSI